MLRARQVLISLRLNVTLAAFGPAARQTFKEQIAVAAGLGKSGASRVIIKNISASDRSLHRRLLQTGVLVDVSIQMPDIDAANAAKDKLTQANINTFLQTADLPLSVTVVSPAKVQGGSSGAASFRAPMHCAVTAAVTTLLAVALAGQM